MRPPGRQGWRNVRWYTADRKDMSSLSHSLSRYWVVFSLQSFRGKKRQSTGKNLVFRGFGPSAAADQLRVAARRLGLLLLHSSPQRQNLGLRPPQSKLLSFAKDSKHQDLRTKIPQTSLTDKISQRNCLSVVALFEMNHRQRIVGHTSSCSFASFDACAVAQLQSTH